MLDKDYFLFTNVHSFNIYIIIPSKICFYIWNFMFHDIDIHIVITIPKLLCDLNNFHPRDNLLTNQIDIKKCLIENIFINFL